MVRLVRDSGAPDAETRVRPPLDQFGREMRANVFYLVDNVRVLTFEDPDDGGLYYQACTKLGTAKEGSRPQNVLLMPDGDGRVFRLGD